MIIGMGTKLTLNEASLIVAIQEWINRETVHPPKVVSITYVGSDTFNINLGPPDDQD